MNTQEEFPSNSTPDIPPGLLDQLPKHERWLYERCWSNEKKADWLILHAKRADDHRTFINAELTALKENVAPAVALASKFSTFKGKSIAAGLALLTIAVTVALTEWVKSIFKGTP
jgi:hypothetical protein